MESSILGILLQMIQINIEKKRKSKNEMEMYCGQWYGKCLVVLPFTDFSLWVCECLFVDLPILRYFYSLFGPTAFFLKKIYIYI